MNKEIVPPWLNPPRMMLDGGMPALISALMRAVSCVAESPIPRKSALSSVPVLLLSYLTCVCVSTYSRDVFGLAVEEPYQANITRPRFLVISRRGLECEWMSTSSERNFGRGFNERGRKDPFRVIESRI